MITFQPTKRIIAIKALSLFKFKTVSIYEKIYPKTAIQTKQKFLKSSMKMQARSNKILNKTKITIQMLNSIKQN